MPAIAADRARNPRLPPLLPCARLLPGDAHSLVAALRARGREALPLQRRGADFGFVVPLRRPDPASREFARDARRRFDASEPVFAPGIARRGLARQADAIERSLRMFERLREGGDFLDELAERLDGDPEFTYQHSSVEHDDPRDVETVFFTASSGAFAGEQDLWSRFAWIADDESDASLRIRHSSGDGSADGFQRSSERQARATDALVQRAFPECAIVDACEPLQSLLRDLLRRPFRLSERILYNNAPDGGAVFHHDAEPGQLGVCYCQFEGRTAWLSLSKRRLARLLVRDGLARDERAAIERLDHDERRPLWRRLNRDADFARVLAAHGALYVLEAGDAILLPSQAFDDCAWHSVIALGSRPSLAHSYGIFPAADPGLAPAHPRTARTTGGPVRGRSTR